MVGWVNNAARFQDAATRSEIRQFLPSDSAAAAMATRQSSCRHLSGTDLDDVINVLRIIWRTSARPDSPAIDTTSRGEAKR